MRYRLSKVALKVVYKPAVLYAGMRKYPVALLIGILKQLYVGVEHSLGKPLYLKVVARAGQGPVAEIMQVMVAEKQHHVVHAPLLKFYDVTQVVQLLPARNVFIRVEIVTQKHDCAVFVLINYASPFSRP